MPCPDCQLLGHVDSRRIGKLLALRRGDVRLDDVPVPGRDDVPHDVTTNPNPRSPAMLPPRRADPPPAFIVAETDRPVSESAASLSTGARATSTIVLGSPPPRILARSRPRTRRRHPPLTASTPIGHAPLPTRPGKHRRPGSRRLPRGAAPLRTQPRPPSPCSSSLLIPVDLLAARSRGRRAGHIHHTGRVASRGGRCRPGPRSR